MKKDRTAKVDPDKDIRLLTTCAPSHFSLLRKAERAGLSVRGPRGTVLTVPGVRGLRAFTKRLLSHFSLSSFSRTVITFVPPICAHLSFLSRAPPSS